MRRWGLLRAQRERYDGTAEGRSRGRRRGHVAAARPRAGRSSSPACTRTVATVVLVLLCSAASAETAAVAPRPHVVNGVDTQARPTTGALLRRSAGGYALLCSGTLIGCRTFLTAAHCVCAASPFSACGVPDTAGYAVYLQNAGIAEVAAIDVDPTYRFGVEGDVAVVTLSEDVTGIPPTPINTEMRVPEGSTVDLAGYGLTRGGAGDTGILREGRATSEGCHGRANDAAHVCWVLDAPLGAPGTDSGTCNGDSGGPLFVDFGSGPTLAGVASGGSSVDCLPDTVSFDTDVYVHRAFIESIGGADLLNLSCGNGSQVGDAATEISRRSFRPYTSEARECRWLSRRLYTRYATRRLRLQQGCLRRLGAGHTAGPCPDSATARKLATLAAAITPARLATKCPPDVVASIGAASGCTGAVDAAELATCLVETSDTATEAMIDGEYAEPARTAPVANAGQRYCQATVAKAMGAYVKTVLRAQLTCDGILDAGRTDACPDAVASAVEQRARTRAFRAISAACSDSIVAALDEAGLLGGLCAGVDSVPSLQECEHAQHADGIDAINGILARPDAATTFTVHVPDGAGRLVLTLNGGEDGGNDLDLYARLGFEPTASEFDVASLNGGTFEGVSVDAPASGDWRVRVGYAHGTFNVPFQLNATVFRP